MIAGVAVRPKVLVIDDEVGPRESLRILLKNEYVVLLADSVDRGIELLREEAPDVVVMDIRMPGKSGIEGLQEIRALDASVSVVMLTGFGALETAQQAIRLGANDYLRKPFDTREMMDIIKVNLHRTKLERQRSVVSKELRALNTELVNELTVKEHMAHLGHATSELVHDLRNPLTVVHGYAQLLEEELDSLKSKLRDPEEISSTVEYLNIISRNVQRCCELTETWRTLGRGSDANRPRVRVVDLVEDVFSAVEPMAISAGAELLHQVENPEVEVCADPIQIFRALQNLTTNAVHAVADRKQGRVQIQCRSAEPNVVIDIVDNGCGIPQEHLSKIFEPYYTTKDIHSGTGLGLSITRKVVGSHGGTIEVRSVEGEGTTFTVQLPIARD